MELEEKLKAAQTALYEKMEADKATYFALIGMSASLVRADDAKRETIADEFAAMGIQ